MCVFGLVQGCSDTSSADAPHLSIEKALTSERLHEKQHEMCHEVAGTPTATCLFSLASKEHMRCCEAQPFVPSQQDVPANEMYNGISQRNAEALEFHVCV